MNLSVNIAGVEFKNPIITASGTFGFGREYGKLYPLSLLGGITVKGLTLETRQGNIPPRIAETPQGILNSVGLQNPGIESFLRDELPFLKQQGTVIIANIAGNTIEDYCEMARRIGSSCDMVEMNISCPNVKAGGVAFGTSAAMIEKITAAVKQNCKVPLVVKLSPNVTDITEMARAAESAGADALSLINTLLGMRIDVKTRKPILGNNVGGLSGPAVLPVAVRMVWQVANAVKIPLIGMGGVVKPEDAVELMLAGASAVAVGTANFSNPFAAPQIVQGIADFMEQQGIQDVNSIIGAVKPN